jgi:23S rRNA pseudouridine955/2504/2580 synthase
MKEATTENRGARQVVISADEAGQRLDNFLLARLRGAPRALIYRIVRGGEVRVNSARARPDRRLDAGDRVRIPPVRLEERAPGDAPRVVLTTLAARVVYEDDALMVIDKPSGLAVHGGSGLQVGLIEALRQLRPDCRALELVHRLDRETSGCVMISKKRSMLRHLHAALREGQVHKTYAALVRGRWPKKLQRVTAALEKNVVRSGERVVRADAEGKASETLFRVIKAYRDATLVEASPVTGRTHQIRVHAQVSGHPIAGDDKYGDKDFNRAMKAAGLKRLFLHAERLELTLPDGRPLRVEAPLDAHLASVLEQLP